MPQLSKHFEGRAPSAVRLAQIAYADRKEKPENVINVGIGNVSLPTNPAMKKRMFTLDAPDSPFNQGVIKYTMTAGYEETQNAFKNILEAQGFNADMLNVQVTDGGSAAMELIIIGLCGAAGTVDKPLLLIDPAYTNYQSFAERTGRGMVTVQRTLSEDGTFTLPSIEEIERAIIVHKPSALVVIPFDNPTGQYYDLDAMKMLGELCVKYDMWMVSDEAYRELYYEDDKPLTSIWALTNDQVKGIEGRRISIETASKVWNACGLRIGALVTDNHEFYTKSIAENTANLCPNAIGQYIFGALAHESKASIAEWCKGIREYYRKEIKCVHDELLSLEPKLIVSSPSASIYTVIDVRNIVGPNFKALDFVLYCAKEGAVTIDGVTTTLLCAPMSGFYNVEENAPNPGDTQFRLSFVESPDKLKQVPKLFVDLLKQYEQNKL